MLPLVLTSGSDPGPFFPDPDRTFLPKPESGLNLDPDAKNSDLDRKKGPNIFFYNLFNTLNSGQVPQKPYQRTSFRTHLNANKLIIYGKNIKHLELI